MTWWSKVFTQCPWFLYHYHSNLDCEMCQKHIDDQESLLSCEKLAENIKVQWFIAQSHYRVVKWNLYVYIPKSHFGKISHHFMQFGSFWFLRLAPKFLVMSIGFTWNLSYLPSIEYYIPIFRLCTKPIRKKVFIIFNWFDRRGLWASKRRWYSNNKNNILLPALPPFLLELSLNVKPGIHWKDASTGFIFWPSLLYMLHYCLVIYPNPF